MVAIVKLLLLLPLLLIGGCMAPSPEEVHERYPNVTVSRLIRVIDGDTFVCDIDELSALIGKNIRIRLKHIDTPELRARDPEERQAAQEEKQRLTELLTGAKVIELKNVDRCKYFRILSDIYIDGEDIQPRLNPQYLTNKKINQRESKK